MNDSTEKHAPQNDEWAPCQAGELGGLGRRLRAAEARRQQTRLAGGAASVLAIALAVFLLPGGETDPSRYLGGISCERCMAAMPAYHTQLVQGAELESVTLSAEEVLSVAQHLEVCHLCRDKFDQLYPGALSGAAAAASLGWLALAARRRRV